MSESNENEGQTPEEGADGAPSGESTSGDSASSDSASSDSAPSPAEDGKTEEGKSEDAAPAPETTGEVVAQAAETAAKTEKGDTFLGIKVHNLIFVGMALGIALGLFTYNLDHFEKVQVAGEKEAVAGEVRKEGTDYLLTLPDGEVQRFTSGEVTRSIPSDTPSGDTLILASGEQRQGEVRQISREVVVLQPNGIERRIDGAEVEGIDEPTSVAYNHLIWWFNLFGKVLFMGALKMLIAPLILASIIAGIVSLPGLDQLKRIGLKTMGYYVITTTVAVTIGLVAVLTIQPGKTEASKRLHDQRASQINGYATAYTEETGQPARKAGEDGEEAATADFKTWVAQKEAERAGTGHEAARFTKVSSAQGTTAGDIFKNKLLQPMLTNPFESLTKAKSLGIIFFALLFGIAIVFVGAPAKPVAEFFVGFNEVIVRITKWLMSFAPFCVMCLVAELIATDGPEVFSTLAAYCVTVIVGIGAHVAFLVALAYVIGGKTPLELWRGIREAYLIAFTTRSSAATLPVTMRCVTNQLGVHPKVANFALPVGATMNMDGTALYEGVAVIYLIQIYQGLADVPIELGGAITLVIFVTAVMASVGAAAVPDAGLVTMVLVATAVGLPVYYIPLIFAVDAFLDMFRTSTNVLGDSVGCLVVQRLEDKASAG